MLSRCVAWFTPNFFCWIRFDWKRSMKRSKWFRCNFELLIRLLFVCDPDDGASVAATVVAFVEFVVVCFFDLCLSSGKHPVDLFNCSIDWYIPISDETIESSLCFVPFSSSSSWQWCTFCRFGFVAVLPTVEVNSFIDGTGDGVVSKRVIPSNNTCVLMSSLSGSSLNIDTRFR